MATKFENEKGRLNTAKVTVDAIDIMDDFNRREDYGDLDTLKNQILAQGLIEPLQVKRNGQRYDLIEGHRRLAAIKLAIDQGASFETVGVVIVDNMPIEKLLVRSLLSNGEGKKPFTPAEMSKGINKLKDVYGWKSKDIASAMGLTESRVSQLSSFDTFATVEVKAAVANGHLPMATAEKIVAESKKTNGDIGKAQAEAIVKAKSEKAKKPAERINEKARDELSQLVNQVFGDVVGLKNWLKTEYKAQPLSKREAQIYALGCASILAGNTKKGADIDDIASLLAE